MGRKKSLPPEPLQLVNGDQEQQHQHQHQQPTRPEGTHSVRSKPTHVAQTQQRLGETDQRMSPAPTASPNSPRSPFSKYNSHQAQPQSSPSKQLTLQHTPATSPDSETPTTAPRKQPHIAELQLQQQQPRLPPITSTISASPPKPPPRAQTHEERRLKSSHGQRHDDQKHAPKQGFFFNFSKTPRSSDRPPTHPQGLQDAHPARGAMNGADQPTVAKQSSKQSGT